MITFLIVDDSVGTREYLKRIVVESGFNVKIDFVYASTLEEAKEKTVECNPHLTFLDLGLPDASMEEVIASIPAFKPPVIVVSAYAPDFVMESGKTVMAECLVAGAEEYLEKGSKEFFNAPIKAFQTILRKYGPKENASNPL